MKDLSLNKDVGLNELDLSNEQQLPEVPEVLPPESILPENANEELIFEHGQTKLYLRSSSKSVIVLYNLLIHAIENNLINLNGVKKEPHQGVG